MKKSLLTKLMLLLCALIAGSSSVWADSAGFTLQSLTQPPLAANADPKTTTISGSASETWNVEITGTWTSSTMQGSSGSKYWQMGANGAAITSATFSTSGITGTISSVVVNCASYQAKAKVNCTIGGNNFGTQNQSTPSWSSNTGGDVTFSGSASGAIVVTIDNSASGARAAYIKSITVTYSSGGNSVSQPTFSPAAGAVTAGTTVTLTQASADAIRYTTDGTDPTKTTGTVYSDPITITTATTIKAIAIKGENVSSVASASYTISVTAPTYNPEGGSYIQGTSVAITSTGNTIYYNMTTDGSTPSTPTNASTKYTDPIALGSGTTKIKAIAYDTYGNTSSVISRTYTGIAPTSLPFSWTGASDKGKTDLASQTGVVASLGSDYANAHAPYKLKFDEAGKYVFIYADKKPETVSFTAKLLTAATTGTILKVQGSGDGLNFTDVQAFTIKGDANATFEFRTTNAFAETDRVVRLIMTTRDQNVGVGTIAITDNTSFPIIPAKEYTTLTSAFPLDFTGLADLEAYIATGVAGSYVQMAQVNKVPAGTGLVLKATTPGSAVNVPVFDGTGADDVSANKMAGSATATTAIAANGGYILKDGAFHPASNGTLPAGKAYLDIAVSSAPVLLLNFNDDVTGIADVRSKMEDVRGNFFDLQGRKVAQPTKGLYIVNGKKYVVK